MALNKVKAEQFAFRVMKEVRSFIHFGGTEDEAIAGQIIALGRMLRWSKEDVEAALSQGQMGPRASSGHGNVRQSDERRGQDPLPDDHAPRPRGDGR